MWYLMYDCRFEVLVCVAVSWSLKYASLVIKRGWHVLHISYAEKQLNVFWA